MRVSAELSFLSPTLSEGTHKSKQPENRFVLGDPIYRLSQNLDLIKMIKINKDIHILSSLITIIFSGLVSKSPDEGQASATGYPVAHRP